MTTETVKWKQAYAGVTGSGDTGAVSFLARTDGVSFQKQEIRNIYETPYEVPLDEWMETLKKASAGLIDPTFTITSYDGGERGGYYEGPSSEITVKGWTENLTVEELKDVQAKFAV